MANKQTPVNWLMEELSYDIGSGIRLPSHNETAHLNVYFDKALQMEAQKQQKYNEMLEFIQRIVYSEHTPLAHRERAQQLIKEAQEL